MYFDVSERIARKTNHPRSEIEKIDEFLAGPHVRRFELHQLQEKTGLDTDVSPILDAYVEQRVLIKENVYLCPEHHISLKPTNKSEWECIDCAKIYAFEDCDTKTVYECRRDPDRKNASANKTITSADREKPWYKQPTNIIGLVGLGLMLITAIFACVTIIPILFPPSDSQNSNGDSKLTQPTVPVTRADTTRAVNSELTAEFLNQPESNIPTQATFIPAIELSEVTPQQTLEPGNRLGDE